MHSRTVASTLNAHSFTVFILKITLHSKRIHKLAKHAESYCSLWGGESLNSCPNTGCLHIHSAVHKLSCSSTTRCHHSAVHKQWWASLRLQSGLSLTCTVCGPAPWKESFLQRMETESDWTKPSTGKIIAKHQLLHWIVEDVVFLAYFRREIHGHPSFQKRQYLV